MKPSRRLRPEGARRGQDARTEPAHERAGLWRWGSAADRTRPEGYAEGERSATRLGLSTVLQSAPSSSAMISSRRSRSRSWKARTSSDTFRRWRSGRISDAMKALSTVIVSSQRFGWALATRQNLAVPGRATDQGPELLRNRGSDTETVPAGRGFVCSHAPCSHIGHAWSIDRGVEAGDRLPIRRPLARGPSPDSGGPR